jgi:hypothetical protein
VSCQMPRHWICQHSRNARESGIPPPHHKYFHTHAGPGCCVPRTVAFNPIGSLEQVSLPHTKLNVERAVSGLTFASHRFIVAQQVAIVQFRIHGLRGRAFPGTPPRWAGGGGGGPSRRAPSPLFSLRPDNHACPYWHGQSLPPKHASAAAVAAEVVSTWVADR